MRLNHETAAAAVSSMPSLNWLKSLLMFAQWTRQEAHNLSLQRELS